MRRLRLWLARLLCPKGWSLITDNEYTRAGNALWGEAVRNPTSLTSIKTEGGYGYMFTGGVADPDVNIPGSNTCPTTKEAAMPSDAKREAFEAWWTRVRAVAIYGRAPVDFSYFEARHMTDSRQYVRADVQRGYDAWLAALAWKEQRDEQA